MPEALQQQPPRDLPSHVAIIMDGNRRWARARGLPGVLGHRRGADAVRRAVEGCCESGIPYLTLYAFSSENWARPRGEIAELMNLLRYYLRREIDALDKNGVRVRVIGERGRLDDDILALIAGAEERTARNARLQMIIALNYGGRSEIVRAAKRAMQAVKQGEASIESISEDTFARFLDTADVPDPDLLIRTGGEHRVSNFLLWQLAYTELVFLPVSWPDFSKVHLNNAIAEFMQRERRYGASAV